MMFTPATRSSFIEVILTVAMDLNMSWLVMRRSVLIILITELKYMILKKVQYDVGDAVFGVCLFHL